MTIGRLRSDKGVKVEKEMTTWQYIKEALKFAKGKDSNLCSL